MRIPLAILGALLLASLALNAWLVQRNAEQYRAAQALRADPLGLDHHPVDGAGAEGGNVVVVFGDSRARAWPAPEGLSFVNRGIGRETSSQALERFVQHVAALSPAAVLVQVGVNDLKRVSLEPERRDEVVEQCAANIEAIVVRARALGARVVLSTIFPIGPPPLSRRLLFSPDEIPRAVSAVNARLLELRRDGVRILDTAPLLGDAEGVLEERYAKDWLHLSVAGYEALNAELAPLLAGAGVVE